MHKDGALCTGAVYIITIDADHDDDDYGSSLGRQEKDDSYRLPTTGFRVTRSQVKRLILLHRLPAGGFMIIVHVRQSKTLGGSVGGYPIDIKLTNARPVSLNNKRFSFVVVIFFKFFFFTPTQYIPALPRGVFIVIIIMVIIVVVIYVLLCFIYLYALVTYARS